jgi:hypothetical protein
MMGDHTAEIARLWDQFDPEEKARARSIGFAWRGEPGFIPPPNTQTIPCGAYYRIVGCYCTRERGHLGDHAAHGGVGVMLARWPQATLN